MPVFFIIIVILIIALNLRIKHLNKQRKERTSNNFLTEDAKANFSRSKDLDEEMFIQLTKDDLPFREADYYGENTELYKDISELQRDVLLDLNAPIIKTDIPTNIELKQRYGVSNLQTVIDGEENHMRFIQHLNAWAQLLIENGYTKDAETILEKAVFARSDISKTYIMLHTLYKQSGKNGKIRELSEKIELLPETAKIIANNGISKNC